MWEIFDIVNLYRVYKNYFGLGNTTPQVEWQHYVRAASKEHILKDAPFGTRVVEIKGISVEDFRRECERRNKP